jgi:NAD(P)-dependent dehydrogenase (short-subunit alcohol dehydrogenase family)
MADSVAFSDNAQAGKVWLITGASTGFGRELAEHLLQQEERVVATARKPEQLADLVAAHPATALALPLDVTSQQQVDAAIAAALAKFGKIDVLVNNAGYGMVGAIEESAEDEFGPMFATNVFGLIRVTQAVLPHMRERAAGTIVNLSSIGGLVASPGFGMYNATKFAVEGLSEALSQEVKPLGIHVIIVEPGPFRTDFLGRSGVSANRHIEGYEQTSGKMRAYFKDMDGKQAGDPKKGVAAIVKVVESENPPLHLLLGASTIPRLKGKIDALLKDVAAWEETTVGADFPAGT